MLLSGGAGKSILVDLSYLQACYHVISQEEEKTEEKTEEEKKAEKSRPVSSTPVQGTPW